jgi:uncharacterized protein YcgI (DUF1989 family)
VDVSVPAEPLKGPAKLTTLPPRSGTAFVVERGATLAIVDPEGEQVADLVAFAADDPRE